MNPSFSHYLSQSEQQSLTQFNQQHNFILSSSTKSFTKNNIQKCVEKQQNRDHHFYCKLNADDEYEFDIDQSTTDSFSKKSQKLVKFLMKQKYEDQQKDKQLKIQPYKMQDPQKNFGFPEIRDDQGNSNADMLSNSHTESNRNFDEQISSISYIRQVSSSGNNDSTWMKLIKKQSQSNLQENQVNDDNFEESKQSQDNYVSSLHSDINPQKHQQILPSQKYLTNNPFSQQNQLPFYPYKRTSLSLKPANTYLKKYLTKRLIIHPQYSTIIEDRSQLAVEGKMIKLKPFPQSPLMIDKNVKKSKRKISQTLSNYNFLEEVFGKDYYNNDNQQDSNNNTEKNEQKNQMSK